MKCVVPHYYKKFVCIADKCHHNCCEGGWYIELSEDMVQAYNGIEGVFGKRLRESVMRDEEGSYVFRLQNGKCPHLDEKGLCGVYKELGESCMGTVCREFPRFSYFYNDTCEASIGMACEEAARIILTESEDFGLEEIDFETAGIVTPAETMDAEDAAYIQFLKRARTHIFQMLWQSEKTIPQRIMEILDFSEELQRYVNCGSYEEKKDFGKKSERLVEMNPSEEDKKTTGKLLLEIYESLEQLNNEWMERMEGIRNSLFSGCFMTGLAGAADGERMQLQILSYFIYRYFVKSVEDYNVSDKLRLSVCNFIMLMAQLAGVREKKQAELSLEEIIEELRVFSRQVEYSEDNIESICEELNFGDELSESHIKLLFFE